MTTTTALDRLNQQATMTIPDAADVLGIGLSCAYNAARRGELPTITMGRRRLVPCQALRDMLAGAR